MPEISVVIPAFNEEQRLPNTLEVLQTWVHDNSALCSVKEIIIIDDGSTDGTSALVKRKATQWPLLKVFSLPQNQGKGEAVHVGMKQAVGEWILVADADMATPWDELKVLLSYVESSDLIMGSRALAGSHIVKRQHWFRQSLGKTFNHLLKVIMRLPFKDTQCGFKLVKNDAVFTNRILPFLEVRRFAWDVELILFFLKEHRCVQEVPVRWEHKEHSRVHIVRDSFEMLYTVVKLKVKLLFK
ncbi:MAG: glycosyltransferase family 2 protein [Bdellovibrio sp.]|nr:glycosyltransferase family 2 protein [Bdellovibrio sp.]